MNEPVFAVATKALILKDDKLLILYKSETEVKTYSDEP